MFRIGEFSTIARVSGRLLRYYDEIGLLRPARIDPESGYRFYSTDQLPRLNRILALKELGLTLDQISRLLEDDLPLEEMRQMLTVKQAEMEQALGDGLRRIRSIQLRLKQIEEAGAFTGYDIVVKPIPAHRILGSRQIVPNTEQGFQLALQLAQELPEQVGPENLDRFVVTLFSEEWTQENLDVEFGYILAIDQGTQDIEIGLLVSNAGQGSPGSFLKHDPDQEARLVHLNTTAHMRLAHLFGNKMVDRGRGGILLTSSVRAYQAMPYMASYSAAKAYILNFGEALHVELKKHGVDVTVLVPGPTDTPAKNWDGMKEPSGMALMWMKPEQVVRAALKSLGKAPSVTPGLMNKFMSNFGRRLMSRRGAASVFGSLTKAFTQADRM